MIPKLIGVIRDKMGREPTLSDIAPDADLLLWCNACHHHITIPIADAIARYGAGRTVPSIKALAGPVNRRARVNA